MELVEPLAPIAPETEPKKPLIPWEDPAEPRIAALFRTLRALIFDPVAFFRNMGRNSWAEPLAFGLITGTTGLLACLFWYFLVYAAISQPAVGNWGIPQAYTAEKGLLVFLMLLTPVFTLFDLGVGAFCLWGAVALLGASREFNPVWRLYNYAQGAMVAAIVPVLGVPLAGLWVQFLVFQAVQAVFSVSPWRAMGILLLFLFLEGLFLGLLVGGLAALLAFLGFWLFLG